MIFWPSTLPQHVDRDGYQEGTGDGRLRSQTDTGPAKVRRRFSAMPRPLSVTMTLTGDQLAIFETFYRNDLGLGTLPFQFPAQRGGGTWVVQFAQSAPVWVPSGLKWRLTLDLVVLP